MPTPTSTTPTTVRPLPARVASSADAVIETTALTKTFGSQVAVNDLQLTVYAGEIFGFLGHNGAGKTTTVRLLNGILAPTRGQMRVLGLDPTRDGAALRQRTGVLTETPSLDDRMTAFENLATFAAIYNVPRAEVNGRVHELLTLFGLVDRGKDRVGTYSKGMKQRLALARALIHHPDLIFLDEPASGLDPVATRHLHDLILSLSRDQGKTVFLCTHNLTEAQKLCHRVAVLQQGAVLALGTPSELARAIVADIRLSLEVEPEHVALAQRVLTAWSDQTTLPTVGEVQVSSVTRSQIPAILTALLAAGVSVYSVTHDEPTLEDVYLALHHPQEAA